jgi:hypothetical protein
LADHLRAVADMAACFSQSFDSPRWAYLAGLWHDLGKYRPGFQRYLMQSDNPDAHIEGKVGGFEAVMQAMAQTPRCSSMVENLNSRLRNYFTLLRQLGGQYLELLKFFLNHRTFLRSRVPERVGKSPCQILTGGAHPHWLTMLGFGPRQPQRS